MDGILGSIRKRLRLAMNGAISMSMRQKGMNYKLIFGVPIPEIKQIAKDFKPDVDLARTLWKEDVREMKILATLLYPACSLDLQEACQWVKEIPYPEIVEQCCNNLFPNMEKSSELAVNLLLDTEIYYGRMSGFLLFAQLFKRERSINQEEKRLFLTICEEVLHSKNSKNNYWYERQAAMQALKFFGRQSSEQAGNALHIVESKSITDDEEMKNLYDELLFEFEYYRK